MTWYAGRPSHFVRTLRDSTTIVRAVEADERGFGGLGRGLVLLQRRDPLERLEQRVGVDELGERLAEVVVEVGDADEVGRGLVRPADQPVLVHDDAVGAQLEQRR